MLLIDRRGRDGVMSVYWTAYDWQVRRGMTSGLSVGMLMIGFWWRDDVMSACGNAKGEG
jgi:hypothetical protein